MIMIKCSPEAFAKCKTRCHHCGSEDVAYFLEGSDCDKFNKKVAATPKTNADRIRAMSDEELVDILITIRCQECPADPICDLPTGNFGKCRGTCVPQLLKWLKQPAKNQHKHFPNGDCT